MHGRTGAQTLRHTDEQGAQAGGEAHRVDQGTDTKGHECTGTKTLRYTDEQTGGEVQRYTGGQIQRGTDVHAHRH